MAASRDQIIEVIYAPLTGGSESLALAICKQWKRQGIASRICCLYEREGELTRTFESAGIPYDLLDVGRKPMLVRWFVISRYLARMRPSAIHVHHLGMLINIIVPAYLTGCWRLVYTEHSSRAIEGTGWMRWAAWLLSRFVTKVTCVSRKLRDYLRDLRVPASKLAVVYNGVDVDIFRPRKEGARGGLLRVGAVGRLVEEKDYPTLLRAFATMKQRGVPFEGRIVGDGPLAAKLVEEADALGLAGSVRFEGKRDDIPDVLQSLDVYVLASKSEGMPIALLEAMATGLPIVSTAVGAVPEVITNEVNGLIVPIGDVDALAEAMTRLAGDGELRARLGQEAQKEVRNRYSIQRATRLYAEYLGIT